MENYTTNESKSSSYALNLARSKINNDLQINTFQSFKNLRLFVDNYINKNSDDNSNVSNIIDQGIPMGYCIPHKLLPRFFEMLEKCRRDGVYLNFAEKQLEPSGIMLDFDILQNDNKSQLNDNSHFYNITRRIFDILLGMIDFEEKDSQFYVMFLKKDGTEYKDSEKCFKDGFHILIPGIKISRNVKKYLIKKIIETNMLKTEFEGVNFKGDDINEILDKNSSHVVTLFPGCCKMGGKPYLINTVYKISIKGSKIYSHFPVTESIKDGKFNVVYEFSVNYDDENSLFKKEEVSIKEGIIQNISQWISRPDIDKDKDENDLSILNMHDPDSVQLKRIIDILDPELRCGDQGIWFRIVCALAYMGDRYKVIARYFSGIRKHGGVRVEFEKVWSDALSNKKYPYSKKMIYNYAKIDNPLKFKIIMNESLITKLLVLIHDEKIGGYFDHWHIAHMLKEMVGDKFVVDFNDNTASLNWFEFVLEDDPHTLGEIYKWRCCNDPHTLRNYISTKVPILFKNIIGVLNNLKNEAADEALIKYYGNLIKSVIQSNRKLYNNGFKNGIINESESIFREINFAKQLDKEENVMGVGNGILVFNKVVKLVKGCHNYKISRYSSVIFKNMDPKDPIVKSVYKSLWDLFPEGEKDAFHYVMFFLSTSLTGRLKACLFLTLRGNGANGKSYLMELVRNLLGGVMEGGYGCKLPIQYLIEREQMSNNASPVLMPLAYARLTYFSESNKSEQLRVSKKKQLTSHEPISVRPLYGKQQNIVHKSNFVVQTNYAFTIDTTDHGTWRRERYYTMKIKFCKTPNANNSYEKQDDPSFSVTKARDPDFLSGMLSILTIYWSILDIKYDGNINSISCPTITRETEIFRNSQDIINRFITERIVITVNEEEEMGFNELVDTYCRWYDANVKERRHDRLDISLMFQNSRLGEFVVKKINGTLSIKKHRALGSEEEKKYDEKFMIKPMQDLEEFVDKKKSDSYKNEHYESSDKVLQNLFDDYTELVKGVDIKYW